MFNKDLFNHWNLNLNRSSKRDLRSFTLNFGPQHPAAHGVLRMVLQMKGELIEKLDTHIGLLHRGSEKLLEDRNYLLGLPYFDRMDYVSVLCQEHSYCLAIEELLGTQNYKGDYVQVRVIYDELTRILNHLLCIATHSLDVGCMASVFWGFEEREEIMEFYERVSGARMHAAFYRPNDLSIKVITENLLRDILVFCRGFLKRLANMENKLEMSSLWRHRLVGIGTLDSNLAIKYGATGVLLRSSGIKRDIRLSFNNTYSNYYYLNIRSYTGKNGDCYDRYLIRMREMVESTHIISQVISKLLGKLTPLESSENIFGYLDNFTSDTIKPLRKNNLSSWYISMEDVIDHFRYYGFGLVIPRGICYRSIESPKGEFGVILSSDGSAKPYRVKIKPASYHHLQLLAPMAENHFFSDLVTIIGSQDIVLGEVDR